MALDHFDPGSQFADSDDENDSSTAKVAKIKASAQGDEFTGSLKLKIGRNANTTLYFVAYSKLFNNGNGLLPQDKNDLICEHQKSKSELEHLTSNMKELKQETATLLLQPINADLSDLLEKAETDIADLREGVQACAEFKDNAKKFKAVKRRLEVMISQWRKRKRLCMEFLSQMEEATDGAVNAKKCMSGDGQMDIDSDQAVIKGQIAYLKQKRSRGSLLTKRARVGTDVSLSNKKQKTGGLVADESFVGMSHILFFNTYLVHFCSPFLILFGFTIHTGVELKAGRVERIYLD